MCFHIYVFVAYLGMAMLVSLIIFSELNIVGDDIHAELFVTASQSGLKLPETSNQLMRSTNQEPLSQRTMYRAWPSVFAQ